MTSTTNMPQQWQHWNTKITIHDRTPQMCSKQSNYYEARHIERTSVIHRDDSVAGENRDQERVLWEAYTAYTRSEIMQIWSLSGCEDL